MRAADGLKAEDAGQKKARNGFNAQATGEAWRSWSEAR